MNVDLFSLGCECGCAAKIPADLLKGILQDLDLPKNPSLVIGPETLDDAGIYKINDDCYLVQTVDFFPPVAREPYTYGQIAAANSLSDVYAMGGTPLTALAIVCFPAQRLGLDVLKEITRGAVDKLRDAGAVLVGGHSIIDEQPKYGLAVTGTVMPRELMDNAHAQSGDVLILTKPLGTGTTIMAAKGGAATKEQEEDANRVMRILNDEAALAARECGAKCCTDITGFGLLGHAMQMARASGVSMELGFSKIPLLEGVLEFAAMGLLAGATYANRKYAGEAVDFAEDVTLAEQDVLFDPQTSGGLLVACREDSVQKMADNFSVIGRVVESTGEPRVSVLKAQLAK